MEGGLATVYSFVDLAILRVGLAPEPSEAAATPKVGNCSTFKTENSAGWATFLEIGGGRTVRGIVMLVPKSGSYWPQKAKSVL